MAISALMDRLFYEEWTLPPIRFLYFNIAQSLAVFYGKNPWHYYVTQGIPLLLTTALPFGVVGLWKALAMRPAPSAIKANVTARNQLAITVIFMTMMLSFVSHKEVRFLYPLLPVLHLLAGECMADYLLAGRSQSLKATTLSGIKTLGKPILAPLLVTNVVIAYYTAVVHQSGVVAVTDFLRQEYEDRHLATASSSREMTVGFLMPCHSTPWRSHLVYPGISAWALTCEPPVDVEMADRASYLDEADRFYNDPISFMRTEMRKAPAGAEDLDGVKPAESPRAWPNYLAFFEQLEPLLKSALESGLTPRYRECWRHFNSHWHDDSRRRGDVIVWCVR